jgi:hypothetical protein
MGVQRQGADKPGTSDPPRHLGFDVEANVAHAFMMEVVAKLPKGDFELPDHDVGTWIGAHLDEACTARLE